jgi:trehalose 6-phosphate phosphatase
MHNLDGAAPADRSFAALRPPPEAAAVVARRPALFLDVDGSLIDLAPTPDSVVVPAGLPALLARLSAGLDGALVLVSGRGLGAIDRLFAPLVLPAAGQHGLERRDAAGRLQRHPVDRATVERLAGALADFARGRPGLLVEPKGMAVAIHYRAAPGEAEAVVAFAGRLVATAPGWQALAGKMVVELKPQGMSKGVAVERFLAEPPFAGRCPVFVGDDATDEDGFAAAARHGGVAIVVGERRPTRAEFALPDPMSLRVWLFSLAEALEDAEAAERG